MTDAIESLRRERDEAQTAYMDLMLERNQIHAERDEALAEAERWRNAHHEANIRLQAHDCGEEHARMTGYFVQLRGRVEAAGEVIDENGCDCPCDHDAESHDEQCERCLACLISHALWPSVSK